MFQQRYSFTMRLQTNIPSFLSNEEQRYPRHTDAGTDHFLERHLLTEEEMGWPDDENRGECHQRRSNARLGILYRHK